MKIVSWNCQGAFRKKYHILFERLVADVYIIQECEQPDNIVEKDFQTMVENFNYKWIGNDRRKGLAVFSRVPITFEEYPSHDLDYFIPFVIDNRRYFAVSAKAPYIGAMLTYFSVYEVLLDSSTVIIGDFNSNVIWDKKHGYRNHSLLNERLEKLGLVSIYHNIFRERHGEETLPTFFMSRHLDNTYHIDYAYASPNLVEDIIIGEPSKWLAYSDHVPLTLTFQKEESK